MNLWDTPQHALDYLSKADKIPHRTEGEAVLLGTLPANVGRVLDLGTGDGRLLALVKIGRPNLQSVALDFSPAMLDAARKRFSGDPSVTVVEHTLDEPLPDLGKFDAIVSSFAIHHLEHGRKRALYGEIFHLLNPGGIFCNLEHVASATERLHDAFLQRLEITRETEDPSNKLLDMETQLEWLRHIGFTDVDCLWKWLELALMAGVRPL